MSASPYVRQLMLGPMVNFVYLVGAKESEEVAVIDPAWDLDAIERAAAEDGKVIRCAILTHSHYDHAKGVPELWRRHRLPAYLQEKELELSSELQALGEPMRPVQPDERLSVGPAELRLLHTPGHTPGSQCVLYAGALFTGDTVFVGACGRCDFQGGDPAQMHRSIRRLMELPDQTRLYPGHDYGEVAVSTLGRERRQNPYFQPADLASFLALRMR